MKRNLLLALTGILLMCSGCSKNELNDDLSGTHWYGKSSLNHNNMSFVIGMNLRFTNATECSFQINNLPECRGTYTYSKKEGITHFNSIVLPLPDLISDEDYTIEFNPLNAPFTYNSKDETLTITLKKESFNVTLTMRQP